MTRPAGPTNTMRSMRVADVAPGDPHRSAVVVLTDGVDTSSLLKPEEVSAIASQIA